MAATKEKAGGGVGELLRTIVYALLIAAVIRTLLFQPFWIPSGSMKPTLLIGDFVFVNKFAYGFSAASCPAYRDWNLCWFAKDWQGRLFGSTPERGDVVVFKHPASGVDYIKRLVGLPGDRVQMRNGRLFLNEVAVELSPDGRFVETFAPQGSMQRLPQCANRDRVRGGPCEKERFLEILPNGVSHQVLNAGRTGGDDTPEFLVPEGHYFMVGDNRDNSLDSRFTISGGGVGPVPAADLIGRADRIVFSSAGTSIFFFWTWRGDRYFIPVE